MTLFDIGLAVLVVMVACGVGYPLVRLVRGPGQFNAVRVQRFSISKYEAMRTLVSEPDIALPRDEHGRIVGIYLKALTQDFFELQGAAGYLVPTPSGVPVDDMMFLVTHHFHFKYRATMIRLGLVL